MNTVSSISQLHTTPSPAVPPAHARSVRQEVSSPAARTEEAVSVHISQAARLAAANEVPEVQDSIDGMAAPAVRAVDQGAGSGNDRSGNDATPKLDAHAIKALVEQLTGKHLDSIHTSNVGQVGSASPSRSVSQVAGPGATVDVMSAYRINDLLYYSASGVAKADDGAEIGFTVLMKTESKHSGSQDIRVQIDHVRDAVAPAEPETDAAQVPGIEAA